MKIVLSFLIIFTFSQARAQADTTDFKYYLSTSDFKNMISGEKEIVPSIRRLEKDYIKIPKLIDEKTGKRNKPTIYPWAVKVDTSYYFNLRYCRDYSNPEVYIKADIIGNFCVFIIDEDTSPMILNGGTNYGGGIMGALIQESDKWGRNWISKDGKKVKILIAKTNNLDLGYYNSEWKLFSRKDINKVFGLSLTKEEIKELTLENVIAIVLEKNKVD